ncbi:MAG: preprotein translocase subunit SecA [Deltaproteobacteria bacterium]|nr:MAG: preprotein translocase subunit SecA [Deltaproteobacteria bacterium]
MPGFLTRLFGSANERTLRRLWPVVEEVNGLEESFRALPDEAFPEKTAGFRQRLAGVEAEDAAAALEEILPEAFAAVREASRRTIGLRHFDVQLLGGIVLHEGKIAEMKTGEGKTLVATLPLYLNALVGKGAHLVTVNDYLARRDVQWMGPIYQFLGLTVASIIHDASFQFDLAYIPKDYRFLHLRPIDRRDAYRADITYGTNNEFGFDYLRDNMKFSLDEYVQRELHYAIVDEVDNILIDEARTPLIISGPAEESTDKYFLVDRIIPKLRNDVDYAIDEKHRSATLTEEGVSKCERLLGVANLYDPSQIDTLHHVTQALKAHTLFKRDVDYVVKDGEVIIVDEFTGRLMPGRRWSDGLHQAVEAKERVRIERENQTLATITIQNYFRMYAKLGGMTGTADTEAVEFKNIYKLDVVVMPPNKPMRRTDLPDVVYKSEREKFAAVVEEIKECHEKGQPVLVGTTSVEKSERVSKLLKKDGVKHNVLNAINHEAEANIIAQAGRFQQVTIATNMAGRGTDILLGGNPEFLARAEMENEWMRRAGSLQQSGKPHERYEDALRGLRERYDEEVQRAGDEYRKELADLEERRGEALRELTEVHRQILELSPYRALRARFEEVSSVELIPAVRDHDPVPPRYLRVKGELETALLGAGGGAAVASERAGLEELKARYGAVLDAWEQVGHRTDDTARELDERRAEYERGLSTFELALLVKGGAAGNGDLAELCGRYRAAEDAYVEAERLHEEKRGPYEEALRAAEQRYEESRRQYVERVEEIREQLQKAPQEYEARHKEILEKYREVCAAEHEKVVAAGGLHILGTERHEARRIDNQLRGRGGRQGDPGSSRFYLSLEDDLLRIFGADRMQGLMQRLGMEEGVPIEHRLITRAIRNAQEKVEAHNFDIRKHLLEYDDVLNKQREVIYARRRDLLGRDDLKEDVLEMAEGLAEDLVATHGDADTASEEWGWKALDDAVFAQFNFRLHFPEADRAGLRLEGLQDILVEKVREAYERREQQFGPPIMRHLEKLIMLQTLDALWKDHLLSMDHLKEGIGLRGYGQVQPLQAYQKEGYDMFEGMVRRLEADVVEKLMSVQLRTEAAGARPRVAVEHADGDVAALPAEIEAMERRQRAAARMTLSHGEHGPQEAQKIETVRREGAKVGRNDPCPCGSGKKYKKCHGQA